jgi:hypothetical protein
MKYFSFLFLLILVSPAAGQDASTRLQEALRLERSAGDYEGAIRIYRQIAGDSDADRRVLAQAILQLGKAYESLGRTEAFAAYERLARDFSDQQDLVAEARERMRGLAVETSVSQNDESPKLPGSRTILDLAGAFDEFGAVLSPSGRLLAYSPEYKDIEVAEVATSKRRKIDIPLEDGQWLDFLAFSPNEGQLATVINTRTEDDMESGVITLVDIDTGRTSALTTLASLFPEESDFACGWGTVQDWSADGSSLLISLAPCDNLRNGLLLAIVPLSGGPALFLPTIEGEQFEGFGSSIANRSVCFSGDGQHVFTEVQDVSENGAFAGATYIRRYESGTGRSAVWRRSGKETALFGCTWNPGTVLYATRALGGITLREGSPGSLEAGEDNLVVTLPNDEWAVAFSKEGDYVIDLSVGSGRSTTFLTDLDESDFPTGSSTPITDKATITMSLSPSGVLAWTGPRNIVKRYDTVSRSTLPDIQLPETEYGGIWWQNENRLVMRSAGYAPETKGNNFESYVEGRAAIWNTFVLDAEGEVVSSLTAAKARELGIQWAVPLGENTWVGWLPDAGCFGTVDVVTRATRQLACPSPPDRGQARVGLSPTGTHALTFIWDVGMRNPSLGVLDIESGTHKELTLDGYGEFSIGYQSQWLSHTQVLLGFSNPDKRRSGYRSGAVVLDIESGEVVRDLSELLSALDVRFLFLTPEQDQAVVYGRAKRRTSREMVAVVHKVLGLSEDQ